MYEYVWVLGVCVRMPACIWWSKINLRFHSLGAFHLIFTFYYFHFMCVFPLIVCVQCPKRPSVWITDSCGFSCGCWDPLEGQTTSVLNQWASCPTPIYLFSWDKVSHGDMGFTEMARLAGQLASGIFLCPLPWCWDDNRYGTPHQLLFLNEVGTFDLTLVPMLVRHTSIS